MIGRAGKVLRLVRVMRILRVFKVQYQLNQLFLEFFFSACETFQWLAKSSFNSAPGVQRVGSADGARGGLCAHVFKVSTFRVRNCADMI